jgi:hypothetical protein
MNTLQIIEILTIAVSAATVLLIIMNQPHTGDTFGGKVTFAQTRRGFEKQVYNLAIVSSVALFLLVLAGQILK